MWLGHRVEQGTAENNINKRLTKIYSMIHFIKVKIWDKSYNLTVF